MRQQDNHLSDSELILWADGELGGRRAAQVRGHLDACWGCRARMQELERTIGRLVRARAAALGERIGPAAGPGALLRARLSAEMAAAAPSRGVVWRSAPALGALVSVALAILIFYVGSVSADGPRPKNNLTPGETRRVTLGEVCGGSEVETVRDVPLETRRLVLAEYGVSAAQPNAYEIDYLITPDLGGADSIRNLWPQPYSARWNARVKDRLETRLHQLVCEGKVDLATAQHDISTDWIGAYRKYVGANAPR